MSAIGKDHRPQFDSSFLVSPLLIVRCFVFSGSFLTAQVLAAPIAIDAIVAIVDEDIITRSEVASRLEIIRAEFATNNQRLPKAEVLNRQLMELMINESILVQRAKKRGIKISDGQLNQAMMNLAKNNQKSLTEFRTFLIAQGINYINHSVLFS